MIAERLKRLVKFYWADYLTFVILLAVNFGLNGLTPHDVGWIPSDGFIAHRHAVNETVPTWLLVVLAIIVPAVLLVVVGAIFGGFHAAHHAILGFAVNLSLTLAVTNGVKNLIGRHRPDFLDRCQPDMSAISGVLGNPDTQGNGYFHIGSVTYFFNSFCTTKDTSALEDGSRSFPSGHSSMSFAGLFYLTLFLFGIWQSLARNTRIYAALSNSAQYINQSRRWSASWIPGFKYTRSFVNVGDAYPGQSGSACAADRCVNLAYMKYPAGTMANSSGSSTQADSTVLPIGSSSSPSPTLSGQNTVATSSRDVYLADKSSLHFLCAMIPTFLALFIALSRVHDFRHFWSDVFTGSVLGIVTALVFYRWYHMPLTCSLAGMPKPLRWYPTSQYPMNYGGNTRVLDSSVSASSADLLNRAN